MTTVTLTQDQIQAMGRVIRDSEADLSALGRQLWFFAHLAQRACRPEDLSDELVGLDEVLRGIGLKIKKAARTLEDLDKQITSFPSTQG